MGTKKLNKSLLSIIVDFHEYLTKGLRDEDAIVLDTKAQLANKQVDISHFNDYIGKHG